MKKQISPNTFRVATIIVAGLTSIACVILTSIIMIAETAMADKMPWLVPIRFAGCMLPIAIFMIAFVTMNYFGSKNPNIEGMYDFPHFRNGGKKVIDIYLIASVIVTFLLFIVGIMCLAGAFSDITGLLGWAIFFAASSSLPITYAPSSPPLLIISCPPCLKGGVALATGGFSPAGFFPPIRFFKLSINSCFLVKN